MTHNTIKIETKDWSNAGYDLECLGVRLDSARQALTKVKKKKKSWAYQHWSTVIRNLELKWKRTLMLKDVGLKQANRERKLTIDYSWFEGSTELPELNILARLEFIDNWFNQPRIQAGLEQSWENRRNEIVQKARQGLI
jgi:hypothetical protein